MDSSKTSTQSVEWIRKYQFSKTYVFDCRRNVGALRGLTAIKIFKF